MRARGKEPSWRVEIRPEEIRFLEPGAVRAFPPVAARISGAAQTYTTRAREAPGAIEITLTERPCFDSMSGERFPYTAEVRFEGRTLTGCALDHGLTSAVGIK